MLAREEGAGSALRLITPALVALVFAAAGTGPAEAAMTSSFRLETSTGEPSGDIVPIFFGSDIASFRAELDDTGGVAFDAESTNPWSRQSVYFAPPEGSDLMPGRYDGAGSLPGGDPTRPRLDVPFYCQDLSGAFEILQIEQAGGAIIAFWATFDFTCGAEGPRLIGEARFNADVGLVLLAPSRSDATADRALSIEVAAASESTGDVQLAAEALPAGAQFEDRGDRTGRLSWTPLPTQPGAHSIVFTATDALARTDRVVTRLEVRVLNDSIDGARVIEALPFSDVLQTSQATADPGDPACAAGLATVWYTLSVPRRTEILMRLYRGHVGVYTGPPGLLEEVTCAYDPARFVAEPGEVYFIVATGPDGTMLIDEVPSPPPNDDFDQATVVTALPFRDTLDVRSATSSEDDPAYRPEVGSVWYRYTPDRSLSIGASAWGSDYDTTVGVYTGARGALEFIAQLWGSHRLQVEPGVTYHFLVNGPGEQLGGRLVFTMTDRPPLSIGITFDPVVAISRASGVVAIRGETTCSSPASIFAGVTIQWQIGRIHLHAYAGTVVECSDRTPFEASIQTYDPSRFGGRYPPGPVTIVIRASGFDAARGEWADASVSGAYVLRGSR